MATKREAKKVILVDPRGLVYLVPAERAAQVAKEIREGYR